MNMYIGLMIKMQSDNSGLGCEEKGGRVELIHSLLQNRGLIEKWRGEGWGGGGDYSKEPKLMAILIYSLSFGRFSPT